MRLDKYLTHAGIGSRKEVKQYIRKGRVCVNGKLCKKDDTHIDETMDTIIFDGQMVEYQSTVYIMMNKPKGVVSATEDAYYETVMDLIDAPIPKDCFPVGRLDIDTEGLLLICNNGKLAHELLSPKKHVDKKYYTEIDAPLTEEDIHILTTGQIVLDDRKLQPATIEILQDNALYLTIHEGIYHQVKRMMEAVGHKVVYLKRVQMGNLELDETLEPGEWRYIRDDELRKLTG